MNILYDLEEIADLIEQAYIDRLQLVLRAREGGHTLADIGDALGVTEGAVRAMIRRYEDSSRFE